MAPEVGGGTKTTWDPDLYLRFERERTLPCRDLIARILARSPRRIIDLGSGTGSSTTLLRERWPSAQIYGLDSSPEMLAAARRTDPTVEWVAGDLRSWTAVAPFDLVFSNAALQWVPNHEELFPRLLRQVAPRGTLAVQIPTNFDSAAHRRIREVAESPRWESKWGPGFFVPHAGPPGWYYDLLAPLSAVVEVWQTEYFHVLPDATAIVEWVKGTTLRPYLDALVSASDREGFVEEIAEGVRRAYRPQPDGRVLFPFRRLFLIVRRSGIGE